MRSEFDLRSKGRCRLARSSRGSAACPDTPTIAAAHPSPKREDRIVLIRHRLVGDKALGYRLLSRAAYPGVCPHRRCSTRTPRPHDEGRWRRRSLGGVVRPVSPRVPITIITSVGFDASASCRLSPTVVGHRRELGSGARAGRRPARGSWRARKGRTRQGRGSTCTGR